MKVSLYIDDELWKKFKRNVLRKTGDLRTFSSEVQALIRDTSDEDSLRNGFEKMGVSTRPITYSQVAMIRPSVRTSSASMLRKMRKHRFAKENLS